VIGGRGRPNKAVVRRVTSWSEAEYIVSFEYARAASAGAGVSLEKNGDSKEVLIGLCEPVDDNGLSIETASERLARRPHPVGIGSEPGQVHDGCGLASGTLDQLQVELVGRRPGELAAWSLHDQFRIRDRERAGKKECRDRYW
jgi:hypothetical protein